ncbi:MAG: phosphoribosylaminoimidazolesuccinocarboxamide synthase, partial [Acidobacteria bacterium]|nr:phosphoribosylaminoimidazolesuccinocarboxamide synthase [Acidobacteriota bacterium]
KGEVLTQLSRFWFERMKDLVPNHLISTAIEDFPSTLRHHARWLQGRSMLVRRTDPIPYECVVRGYLSGSGWKDYLRTGSICGIKLPAGLSEAGPLPEPIFTPATKAEEGHDLNIAEEEMARTLGRELTVTMRETSLQIYSRARDYAARRGIIIADTKFEFGLLNGGVIWIDEALTPDSSRFWPADRYQAGLSPPSYDKQFVRDHLNAAGWDHQSDPPELPEAVVQATSDKYLEAYRVLTGTSL